MNPIASIALAILAPLAASLIQMSISRAREYEADRGGAEICGDPAALASALDKIQRYAKGIPFRTTEAHPETATNDDHESTVRTRHSRPFFDPPTH